MRWTVAAMLALTACAAVPTGAEAQARPDSVALCVIRDGELREEMQPRGDSVYNTHTYTGPGPGPGYVHSEAFFVNNEPIRFGRRMFVKYGLPRVMEVGELRRLGRYQGVSVFTEVQEPEDDPLVLYLPVRPGCEFQPYQTEAITLGVRG
jgi:hypothetical protein